jgi:hypothetical protein
VYSHESVIDGHNENIASISKLRIGDIAGDVRVGTCRACKVVRRGVATIQELDHSLNKQLQRSIDSFSRLPPHLVVSEASEHVQGAAGLLLKAAGTPTMRPEPSSLERLTLFPGLPSTSSMSGTESPTLTMTAAEE